MQPELAQDPLLVFVFPGPDALDQCLAAQVVAGFLLLFEQPPLDDGLGGDAGVIGAGHPEGVVALHPPPADQDVLERVIERVAQVKGAGDVGRRDHDAVRRPVAGRIGVEIAASRPRARSSGSGRPWGRIAWGGRRSSFAGDLPRIEARISPLHRGPTELWSTIFDDKFAVDDEERLFVGTVADCK